MLELNRSIRSKAEWRGHVSTCMACGMTGVEYARVHGLNVKTFYKARRRVVSAQGHRNDGVPKFHGDERS